MGTWFDGDGLYRKYGTTKAVPNTGGDYLSYGEVRVMEFTITLASLTTSPVTQSDQVFFPTNCFIEEVVMDVETAATGGTSFSVGLIGLDRTTVDSNTKFISAALLATHNAVGQKVIYTAGSTSAGGGIGTTVTNPGYITALCAGTYTAGVVKIRIKYRGIGTITQ